LAIGYNDPKGVQLRFTEEEARGIARLTGGTALVGLSPKKATLYSQGGNYRLLHFSCHGEFDPQAPLASALHLAPGEALTALDVLEHLHLCCDLVTLSACESGLSRVRRGDELIGLIRAFMRAGALALISTLWRVDERSTLILMERFYREIQAGVSLAQALKRAQLYLKNLTRQEALAILTPLPNDSLGTSLAEEDGERIFADPYYWAPFVLVGGRELGTVRG
jgi:CHAT domain-containing protein